eukprot:3408722-Rhodomonas_salina.1
MFDWNERLSYDSARRAQAERLTGRRGSAGRLLQVPRVRLARRAAAWLPGTRQAQSLMISRPLSGSVLPSSESESQHPTRASLQQPARDGRTHPRPWQDAGQAPEARSTPQLAAPVTVGSRSSNLRLKVRVGRGGCKPEGGEGLGGRGGLNGASKLTTAPAVSLATARHKVKRFWLSLSL